MRATAANGNLRAIAAVTTETVREAQSRHRATPVAAAAMGRLATAALLLSADWDAKADRFRLRIEVEGDGPLGRLVAEGFNGGRVRARVANPAVDLPVRGDGKLAVGQAVGRGRLAVTRRVGTPPAEAVYRGEVALVSGEIAEDIAHYLWQSEQVPSAVALGVLVGRDGLVAAAGGVLVQVLPPAEEAVVAQVEAGLGRLDRLSFRLAEGMTAESLLEELLPPPVHWLRKEAVGWGCLCSRDGSEDILAGLPASDLEELAAAGGAEVTCPFCNARYTFSAEEIRRLQAPGDDG